MSEKGMNQLEKVVYGLECIKGEPRWCKNCNYADAKGGGQPPFCRKEAATDALELLKEQQEQKEKWIRDIDLYIADAEDSAKNPAVRSGKGYAVGLSYGLNIAKEIIEGKRNHG